MTNWSVAVELFGLQEGMELDRSIIEFSYKDDALGDPLVAAEHALSLGWVSDDELDQITSMAFRINDFMCGLFAGIGIRLIDYKLEFGRYINEDGEETIILADEISPDTCRLWDLETMEKLDKDRFRRDLGGVEEAYQEVARRLGVLPKGGLEAEQ